MNRRCEICGSGKASLIYQQRFITPSRNAFHAGYKVVACGQYGFSFADDLPDQAFFDAYYREMAKKTHMLEDRIKKGLQEPEFLVRQHTQSVKNALPYLDPTSRILDVGCYTGHLLSLLKAQGFAQLRGVDPSPFAAEMAKLQHGIEVAVGSLMDDLNLGVFEGIFLTHVLEHIVQLAPFLARLRSLLADGGRLYVEVPDAMNFYLTPSDAVAQPEHREPFLQFSVEHVNYFSVRSLENLMRRRGFRSLVLEPQVSTLAIIGSVWEKAPQETRDLPKDTGSEISLRAYVQESQAAIAVQERVLRALVDRGTGSYFWGAGLHTQKLLAQTCLHEGHIVAFVDSDPSYQGGELHHAPIWAPEHLKAKEPLPILVSSQAFQEEIVGQILAMGLPNERITLY